MSAESDWIDISVPIENGMVHWPGDPPIAISQPLHLDRGDPATVSRLTLGAHTGTHVDAPNHFLPGTGGIDSLAPERMIGRARVIEVRGTTRIGEQELREHRPQAGERILLKTSNSERCWNSPEFVPDFAHLSIEGAAYLARCGIQTVGIDYLSIGQGDPGPATHRELLKAGVCIIEGLNLSQAQAGEYELVCLPINIRDGDGAPARALLRRIR